MATRPKPRKVHLALPTEAYDPNAMYLVVGCGVPTEGTKPEVVRSVVRAAREANRYKVFITNVNTLQEWTERQDALAKLPTDKFCYLFNSADSVLIFDKYEASEQWNKVKWFSHFTEEDLMKGIKALREMVADAGH